MAEAAAAEEATTELRLQLADMVDNPLLADVVFVLDGHKEGQTVEVHAHVAILAASCSYFRSMFTSGLRESLRTTDAHHIRLQVNSQTFMVLLKFLYTAHAELTPSNVREVLMLAAMYRVAPLRDLCVEYLAGQARPGRPGYVNPENCLDLLVVARKHAVNDPAPAWKRLASVCLQCLRQDIHRLVSQDSNCLAALDLQTLLELTELVGHGLEENRQLLRDYFQAVLEWMKIHHNAPTFGAAFNVVREFAFHAEVDEGLTALRFNLCHKVPMKDFRKNTLKTYDLIPLTHIPHAYKWHLLLYPDDRNSGLCGLYMQNRLDPRHSGAFPEAWLAAVQYRVKIVNHINDKDKTICKSTGHIFNRETSSWGWANVEKKSVLLEDTSGYFDGKGDMTIEATLWFNSLYAMFCTYLAHHFGEVSDSDLQMVDRDTLKHVLDCKTLRIDSEANVLRALVRWCKNTHDAHGFEELLPLVRFPRMDATALLNLCKSEPFLRRSPVFRRLLWSVIRAAATQPSGSAPDTTRDGTPAEGVQLRTEGRDSYVAETKFSMDGLLDWILDPVGAVSQLQEPELAPDLQVFGEAEKAYSDVDSSQELQSAVSESSLASLESAEQHASIVNALPSVPRLLIR
eukprot:jgi/Chlat1/1570/Chrsp123S01836